MNLHSKTNIMKKLLYLLLALPMMGLITSCDDNDDLPPVDITVDIDGATRVGNVLYVVQGDTINVESISMVDNTAKGAVIGSAVYYWDYYRVGGTIEKPYGMSFSTNGVADGMHLLQMRISIYAVDYSPCIGYVSYNVAVVPSIDDIPTNGDIETNPTLKAAVVSSDDAPDNSIG